jgi:hypothetical protein
MKIAIALLILSLSSATAQMTNAALLRLDRAFAKATTTEHLDGWMKYMMDYSVILGPQGYSQIVQWHRENSRLLSGIILDARFQNELDTDKRTNTTPLARLAIQEEHSIGHGTYLAVWEAENPGGHWKVKALFPSVDAQSVSCGCGS